MIRLPGTIENGPPDPLEEKMVQCPKCGGKGWVEGEWHTPFECEKEDCPTCHGQGLVPADPDDDAGPDTVEERKGER